MITSPFLGDLQSAHQYQGQTNDCGPYCAAITASVLKQNPFEGSAFANNLRAFRWKGILPILQRVPNWATLPWGITYLLRDSNLEANWKPFSSQINLFANLPKNLIQIVIIGEMRPVWAHYLILAAFDARFGYGFIDPANTNPALHWYLPAEFSRLWRNYGSVQIKAYPAA